MTVYALHAYSPSKGIAQPQGGDVVSGTKKRAKPRVWREAARKMRAYLDYLDLPLEARNAWWHKFFSAGQDYERYAAVVRELGEKIDAQKNA